MFFFLESNVFQVEQNIKWTKYEKKFFIFVKREICLNFEKF